MLESDSWHKGNKTPSVKNLLDDEERMRPGHWSQCFVFPSVFSRCWLGDGNGIQSKKAAEGKMRSKQLDTFAVARSCTKLTNQ